MCIRVDSRPVLTYTKPDNMMYQSHVEFSKNNPYRNSQMITPQRKKSRTMPSAPKKCPEKLRGAHPKSGIACAILNGDEIFLLESDRHHWPEGVKDEWEAQFLADAPYQVYTVTEELLFLGETYGAVEQASYIVQHMVSKKWYPKVCFEEPPNAVWSVSGASLEALHAMLRDFTNKVKDHHYVEMVFGGVKTGHTHDMNKVENALREEMEEEAGLSEFTPEHVGFSDPFKSNGQMVTTAVYKTYVDKSTMEQAWANAEARHAPNAWRCPHSWYKFIPRIDKSKAEREKAMQETRNGKWYPMEIHPRMDLKNKQVFKLLK